MPTSDFELEIGTSFQFKAKPQGNFDDIVNGKLLAMEKPHFLSYHWQALADPTRRQIIEVLSEEALTINGIAEHFQISKLDRLDEYLRNKKNDV